MKPDCLPVVKDLRLLNRLSQFDPVLIGTPPLGLAIETSDIDIACHCAELSDFADTVAREFGQMPAFHLRTIEHLNAPSVVASLFAKGWDIELFCQALPTPAQAGVRHFHVERRLLDLAPALRPMVLRAKMQGLKTEPAFARILGLSGDPYEAVLDLETWTDEALLELATAACITGTAKP